LWVFPQATPPIALKSRMPIFDPWKDSRRDRAGLWFDWRGMGQSDRVLPNSVDDLLADLAAMTDLLDGPPDVVSAVHACFPTILFAARFPGRWRSLTLIDPHTKTSESPWATYMRPGWETDYRTHLRALTRTAWKAIPESEYEQILDEFSRDVPLELWNRWADILGPVDLEAVLAQVDMPALVTNGPVDGHPNSHFASLMPQGMAYQQARLIVGERFPIRDAWDTYIGPLVGVRPVVATIGDVPLSAREQEVLCLLATGKSNRQVAEALTLSEATVATHVRHILQKTDTHNRVEAANWAREHGIS
jgi:DNA-binding CsgD family transcriptional regulator